MKKLCSATLMVFIFLLVPSVFAVTTHNLSVDMNITNVAPNITSFSPSSKVLSGNFPYFFYINGTFSDANNDTLNYTFRETLHSEFSQIGNVTGNGFLSQHFSGGPGTYRVILFITDGRLNDSVQWNITILSGPASHGVGAGGGEEPVANVTQPRVVTFNLDMSLSDRLRAIGEKISPSYPALGTITFFILLGMLANRAWKNRGIQQEVATKKKRKNKYDAAIE